MKNHKVTKKDIDKILANTFVKVEKYGDKTTVLMATLPNGFVIVESSSCVDPVNFDMSIGEQICMDKLVDKIWELEGYRLQSELYQEKQLKNELKFNSFGIEQLLDGFKFTVRNIKDDEVI